MRVNIITDLIKTNQRTIEFLGLPELNQENEDKLKKMNVGMK